MFEADVALAAQSRVDHLVSAFPGGAARLRTDYAGMAWIGDRPDEDSGLMGSTYARRVVDSRLFLPDTHWYDGDALDDVEVQVTSGLVQVPATPQGTQGLVGALTEPVVEFYEHPAELGGVGLCLFLRGAILSNVGLSYRVTVLCRPEAVLRVGDTGEPDDEPHDERAAAG